MTAAPRNDSSAISVPSQMEGLGNGPPRPRRPEMPPKPRGFHQEKILLEGQATPNRKHYPKATYRPNEPGGEPETGAARRMGVGNGRSEDIRFWPQSKLIEGRVGRTFRQST